MKRAVLALVITYLYLNLSFPTSLYSLGVKLSALPEAPKIAAAVAATVNAAPEGRYNTITLFLNNLDAQLGTSREPLNQSVQEVVNALALVPDADLLKALHQLYQGLT